MMTDPDRNERRKSWDERYAGGDRAAGEPHRLLIDALEKIRPGKALDLGCGAGRHAVYLAEKGFLVTAIDNSQAGLEIARKKADEKGVAIDFMLADLESDAFEIEENAFDLIIDFFFLHRPLFSKIKKGVRPGGSVVAAIHFRGADDREGGFLLREGELRAAFDDFEILHHRESPPVDTGGHRRRRTAEIVARRPIDK